MNIGVVGMNEIKKRELQRKRHEVIAGQIRIDMLMNRIDCLEDEVIELRVKNEEDRIELRNIESKMESEEDE